MSSLRVRIVQSISNTINVEARSTPVQTAVDICITDDRDLVRDLATGRFVAGRANGSARIGGSS